MDELDGDLAAVALPVALLVDLAGGMALMDPAGLRCAFKRIGRLFSDGDEEVSGGGVGGGSCFVVRHGRLHSPLHGLE